MCVCVGGGGEEGGEGGDHKHVISVHIIVNKKVLCC